MLTSKPKSQHGYLIIIALLILIILYLVSSSEISTNLNYLTSNNLKSNLNPPKSNIKPNNSSKNKLIISPFLKYMNGGFNLGNSPRMIDGFPNTKLYKKHHKNEDYIIGFTPNKTYNKKIIIDIGLFNGFETIGAVLKGFTVFGFEANPARVNKTIVTFNMHNLTNNYTLINCVDKKNKQHLKICSGKHKFTSNDIKGYGFVYLIFAGVGDTYKPVYIANMGEWSSIKNIDPYHNNETEHYKKNKLITHTIRLDDIFSSDMQILLLKTDTQGYEEHVFRGAYNLFINNQIEYIMFELWPRGLNNQESSAESLLYYLQDYLNVKICFDATLERNHDDEHEVNIDAFCEYINRYHKNKMGYYEDIVCIVNY